MHGRKTQRQTRKVPVVRVEPTEDDYDAWAYEQMNKNDEPYYPRRGPFINIYHLDRQFGGHEEGGWYYDTWDIVKVIPAKRWRRALRMAERLRRGQYLNHGNRGLSNYWNKPQDYLVCVEKTPGKDDSNYQPWQ